MIKINVDIYYTADGKEIKTPLKLSGIESHYVPSSPLNEMDMNIIGDIISPFVSAQIDDLQKNLLEDIRFHHREWQVFLDID